MKEEVEETAKGEVRMVSIKIQKSMQDERDWE